MVKKYPTSNWRKTAIAIYKAPRDGKIYGTYEVDATALLNYIQQKKEQNIRITVTNIVTAALARGVAFDVPEINCFVRRGKLVKREHVDVFLAVATKGKNVTGLVIPQAENMTIDDIAAFQQEKLKKRKHTQKKESYDIRNSIGKIPWPFRGLVVGFIKWWLFENGFPLPFVKMKKNPFGSIALSNIGVFGLSTGYMALWPIANLPAVFAMGAIQEKPVVIDGKIVVRPMLPISGTFDHRIMEADTIGVLKDGVEQRLLHPECLEIKKK